MMICAISLICGWKCSSNNEFAWPRRREAPRIGRAVR